MSGAARKRAVRRWPALPDALSLVRLAAVPLLWAVAALGETRWLAIGVALAASTDVLDGAIARRWHRTTARGSRLDSIADHTLTVSLALWLVWLRPYFVREQWRLLALWAALGVTALLVGWVRFHRIGDLHLYSAKLAGTLGYLFAIGLLLFGGYSPVAFYVVYAVCVLAALETLVALAALPAVDEHLGSLLLRRHRQGLPPAPPATPP